MSQATHQLAIKGKDQTGGAFASIENRAAAAAAKMRSALGGALAAAGAYLSLRAISGAVEELSNLSDVAQKTSTSVDELSRATTAMGVLGINMDINGLAKAFQLMEKNTGRTGLQGFYDTIGELGKVPDAADRAAAAMKVFGRSGMEFMPLINAASVSTLALEDVINAMPGIPQAAALAGDDAADAMKIASEGVKSVWRAGIGTVVGWFSKNYEGGIRQAAAEGANGLMYYAQMAATKCIAYFQKAVQYWESVKAYWSSVGDRVGAWIGGMSWEEAGEYAEQQYSIAMDAIVEKMNEIDRIEAARTAQFTAEWEERTAAVEKFAKSYTKAAISTKARKLELGEGGDLSGAAKAPAIRNELIMGGSNAALRTAMLGPQMQAESKKQTALLEKIARNTEKTADNTVDIGGEQFTELN